jgi:trimethylamine--corrinoid protein Co-methyltransferase
VPPSGAQYIHYAFGLLERTNVFCPEQALMDNEHIGIVKRILATRAESAISDGRQGQVLEMVREVMQTEHKTYMYHLPLPTRDPVYVHYPLEDKEGGALYAAHKRYEEIMDRPGKKLSSELQKEIMSKVPGILPETLNL